VNDYPAMIAPVNHVEPIPRRIRAFLGGEKVLDTTRALYVWEWPYYPQYYIPLADVRRDLLIPEGHTQQTGRGVTELRAGGFTGPMRPGFSQAPRSVGSPAPSVSTGPRWMPGSKRMSKSSSTRAARTCGSTRCARTARCGSSLRGLSSPTRLRR